MKPTNAELHRSPAQPEGQEPRQPPALPAAGARRTEAEHQGADQDAARSPTSTPNTPSRCRRGAPASRASSTATDSGRRDHVLPGNKQFTPGDRILKPGQGGGTGPGDPTQRESEDDFRFVLSREEFLDLFFEDLELPDMVKLNLKEIARLQAAPGRLRHDRRPDQHQCRAHHAQQLWPPHRAEAAQAARAGRDCRRTRDT